MTDATFYLVKAFVLGLIEGLTEFLPVSSTGHLIVIGDWLSFESSQGKVFEVVIQMGAILAVMWIFRARLWQLVRGTLAGDATELRFTRNLLIAFFPAAIIGALFIGVIKSVLFQPQVVVIALAVGGVIMLWVERAPGANGQSAATRHARAHRLEDISWQQALAVGCAQCLAMIPGTSRSGATIIGGMVAGINRKTATEFSFFLAMPTMLGASIYDLYRNAGLLTSQDLAAIAVGFAATFVSALLIVRAVLAFVARHTYRAFAWYRIALAGVVALWLYGSAA